jgi:hypothetical protein
VSISTQHAPGTGSLVLIGGEAGIGKTALAEALCRDAADQGALVLVGRCFDLAETPPYGPWVDLFARYQPAAGMPPLPEVFAHTGTVGPVPGQAAPPHWAAVPTNVKGVSETVAAATGAKESAASSRATMPGPSTRNDLDMGPHLSLAPERHNAPRATERQLTMIQIAIFVPGQARELTHLLRRLNTAEGAW